MKNARQQRRRWCLVVLLFLMVGLLLRLPGMFTDFWLDEIWTLFIVHHQVHSVMDVFTVARVDNNHPLNTLMIYWMGDWADWWVYRIPSLLAGLGAIVMAMRIAARRGRPHAVAAGVLFVVSFPMVLYSTEARGYGPLIFFTLWAIDILDQYRIDHPARHPARRSIAFAVAVVLGCLANSTFVLGYAAMLIWSICQLLSPENRRPALKRLNPESGFGCRVSDFGKGKEAMSLPDTRHPTPDIRFLLLHAIPIIFIAAYFMLFVMRLQIGGSLSVTAGQVASQTLGFATGLSDGVHANALAMTIALCFCIGVVLTIAKTSRNTLGLFLTGVLLIPFFILLAAELRGETRLSPRHFLPAIVLLLLAVSFVFGECWQRRGAWRIAATVLFACLFAANLNQDLRFIHLGRGHYLDALSFMLTHNESAPTLTLSSDSPNRTQMILDFYWPYVPHNMPVQYIPPADVARAQPNWYIDESDTSGPQERTIDGLRYARRASYPCYGLSGESWTIYERTAQ